MSKHSCDNRGSMVPREQGKRRTRQALLNAALTLTTGGRSMAGLSLREVTRAAGVSPAAFYRHFRDLDELALAVVDDACLSLRRMTREIRRATPTADRAVQDSVRDIVGFLQAETKTLEFLGRERVGGSPRVRRAIANEFSYFVGELANDLRTLPALAHLPDEDTRLVAGLLVSVVVNFITDVLDTPSEAARRSLQFRAIKELRLILVGARHWDPRRGSRVTAAWTYKAR